MKAIMDYCGRDLSWQKICAGGGVPHAIAVSLAMFLVPLLAGCHSMFVATSPQQRPGRVSVEDLARHSIDNTNRRVRSATAAAQQKNPTVRDRQIPARNEYAGRKPKRAFEKRGTQTSAEATSVRQVQYQEDIYPPAHLAPSYALQTEQSSSQLALPNTLVSDEFIETDVVEAIQSLALQAQLTVILDENVTGTVTSSINNESFANAIQKVCLPLGLHMRMRGNQLLICDGDPESSMFGLVSQRLSYQPLHGTPDELSKMLPEQMLRYVRIANARNMLIIEAPEEIASRIYSELSQYDQPVPQVVLEAMVVVISPDSGFQFGADLGRSVSNSAGDFNLALDGLAISGAWSGVGNQLFSRFATTSHFLRSLEQQGYLSIRATPHVMAKNGEKAEISIARETFFSTLPVDSQLLIRPNIQKVEAGITLEITPTIRGDSVLMVIDRAEVSENIRSTLNDASLADPFPLINRRKVSTTVNVKDGETMVIGGLMQNQLVDRISKLPILGDLPFIGRLFQKIDQQEEAAEVVVFISPRIVRQASDHPYQSGDLQARFDDPSVLNATPFKARGISSRLKDPHYSPVATELYHLPTSDIASRNRIQSTNGHMPQNPHHTEIILHASEPIPPFRQSQQRTIPDQNPPGNTRANTNRVRKSAVQHAGFDQPITQNLSDALPTKRAARSRVPQPSKQKTGNPLPRTQQDLNRVLSPNQQSSRSSVGQPKTYSISDQGNPLRHRDDSRVNDRLR